jgi:toxin CptA
MSIIMSIAITPSRLLRRLTIAYSLACLAMAAATCAGLLGTFLSPPATVLTCTVAGLYLLHSTRRAPTVRTLALFGPGALVLTVQQGDGDERQQRVRLLANSTLWPGLLVLRFDLAPALVLFADSVPPGQFRRLSMALRAVAARAHDEMKQGPEIYY